MGIKLLWTGLTLMLALPAITQIRMLELVGAIFMVIGLILCWLDK